MGLQLKFHTQLNSHSWKLTGKFGENHKISENCCPNFWMFVFLKLVIFHFISLEKLLINLCRFTAWNYFTRKVWNSRAILHFAFFQSGKFSKSNLCHFSRLLPLKSFFILISCVNTLGQKVWFVTWNLLVHLFPYS